MRMMLNVRIPHEPFNTAVKEGTAGPTIDPHRTFYPVGISSLGPSAKKRKPAAILRQRA